MRSLRLASLFRPLALAFVLGAAGQASADVAPPPDGGPPKVDMANPVAQPDMSGSVEGDDGCSMARHGAPGGVAILLSLGALGLMLRRREV